MKKHIFILLILLLAVLPVKPQSVIVPPPVIDPPSVIEHVRELDLEEGAYFTEIMYHYMTGENYHNKHIISLYVKEHVQVTFTFRLILGRGTILLMSGEYNQGEPETIFHINAAHSVKVYDLTPGYYHLRLSSGTAVINPSAAGTSTGDETRISVNIEVSRTEVPGITLQAESEKNYIMSFTPREKTGYMEIKDGVLYFNPYIESASSDNTRKQTDIEVQYFDGLGRPDQVIQVDASPQKSSIVNAQEYDGFGRVNKHWLPGVIKGNHGSYIHPEAIKQAALESGRDNYPFSSTYYELSPQGRIVHQYGAGEAWYKNDRAMKYNYFVNSSSSNLYIMNFEWINGLIHCLTSFNTGKYFVTEITDEDNNRSYEFRDKRGLLVLSRQLNEGKRHDTYYIYDDAGNLLAVLPPMLAKEYSTMWGGETRPAETDQLFFLYGYLYKYDSRNRCIAKRLPGCDWEYYIYDEADRLIFSQDAEQRRRGEWSFSIPDRLGRIVLTGICKNTFNHAASPLKNVQVTAKWDYTANEYRGYTLSGCTLLSPTLLTVNYYDEYGFMGKNGFPLPSYADTKYEKIEGYGERIFESGIISCKGLLTGSWVASLDEPETSPGQYSVMYYDHRGRLIQSWTTNQLYGFEKEFLAYNFAGQVTKRMTRHVIRASIPDPVMNPQPAWEVEHTELYTYAYDHAGRLTEVRHRLDDGVEMLLSANGYDELGRLSNHIQGNSGRVKANYSYNVRSWLKSVTSGNFYETLYFNDTPPAGSSGHHPSYSGNISAVTWHNYDRYSSQYIFAYDNLSRLRSATCYQLSDNSRLHHSEYDYDMHGNPLFIGRANLDNLEIKYAGNMVKTVLERNSPYISYSDYDFKDYYSTGHWTGHYSQLPVYEYTSTGSMTKDPYRGISITYNMNRQPQVIEVDNPVASGTITYRYLATGEKLQALYNTNPVTYSLPLAAGGLMAVSGFSTRFYIGSKIYKVTSRYLPGSIPPTLDKILLPNGYIQDKKYYFYEKDHLGSVRVVSDEQGMPVQQHDYFPFGMPFAGSTSPQAQPYKYNAKEYETMHGVNLYDYHARQYDPPLMRFTTMDPMAEVYYNVSPYSYVKNNPLRYTDPTGMFLDDYFDESGDYLYSDTRQSDEIRIITQANWNKLSNSFIGELLFNRESTLGLHNALHKNSTPLADMLLPAEAYSKIFTTILSRMKDVDANQLYNGKVSVYTSSTGYNVIDRFNNPSIGAGNARMSMDGSKKLTAIIRATGTQKDNRELLSTVSNIQNLLGAHEFIGHGIKGWGDATKTHSEVYKFQMEHPSWSKTTTAYKNYQLVNYQDYLKEEKK